jgi:hypothetical protein
MSPGCECLYKWSIYVGLKVERKQNIISPRDEFFFSGGQSDKKKARIGLGL